MPDPHSPKILAWLETLPLRARLTARHAMFLAFPQLQRNHEWKARIGRVSDELRPTERELGAIFRNAARQAERLKAELAG